MARSLPPGATVTPVASPQSGFGTRLGKAAQAFVSTFFGPSIPPMPTADTQAEGPRQFQFGTNYNVNYTPRGSEGLTPFQTLINIAQLYDTAAACIRYRVEELSTMDWDVQDVDKEHPASESEKADYRAMLLKPDGQTAFEDWIAAMVEEILVTDALAVYLPKTRRGDVLGYELIAGDTVRTLADAHGRTPKAPNPAYQQIIYGRIAWEGSTQDMVYAPKTRRTRSLYGRSPTEEMVMLINRALRRQMHDLNYYAEGNVPEAILPVPDLPPDQIEGLQGWFDNIVSQPEQRRRIHMLPSTTGRLTPFVFKEPILDTEVELFLDKRCMAFYGVPAQNLGFSDHNRAAGALQENVAFMRQMALVKFTGRVVRTLMAQQKVQGMAPSGKVDPTRGWKCQILLHGETPEEDKLRQAQVDKIYIDMGKKTVDELRSRDGETALGINEPFVVTTNGPVYLKQALEQQVAMGQVAVEQAKNPQTGGPKGVAGGQGHGGGGDAQHTDDGQPQNGKPSQTAGEGKFGDGVSRGSDIGDPLDWTIFPDADAVLRELAAWERYASKRAGRRPARPFAPDTVPVEMAEEIRRRLEAGEVPREVLADARTSLDELVRADPPKKRPYAGGFDDEEEPAPASPAQQHRDGILLPLVSTVGSAVLSATQNPAAGSVGAEDTLRDSLTRSYRAGLAVSAPDHVWSEADSAYIDRVVSEQLPYLQGFLGQIGDMTEDAIVARANLYGEPLFGAYSRGLVAGANEAGIDAFIWVTSGDGSVCALCEPREGQTFTADELDAIGYPGEDNFSDGPGGCSGACRCLIEAVAEDA